VSRDFSYWTQVLPDILAFGLGLALTVSPLTSAILGAIDPARSGIASAVNNAVSRIAGLLALGGAVAFASIHNARAADAAARVAPEGARPESAQAPSDKTN
jgi:hypothetical protein